MSKQQVVDTILSHISIDDMMGAMSVAQARIDEVEAAMNAPIEEPAH